MSVSSGFYGRFGPSVTAHLFFLLPIRVRHARSRIFFSTPSTISRSERPNYLGPHVIPVVERGNRFPWQNPDRPLATRYLTESQTAISPFVHLLLTFRTPPASAHPGCVTKSRRVAASHRKQAALLLKRKSPTRCKMRHQLAPGGACLRPARVLPGTHTSKPHPEKRRTALHYAAGIRLTKG
jgi:hypothetical protein